MTSDVPPRAEKCPATWSSGNGKKYDIQEGRLIRGLVKASPFKLGEFVTDVEVGREHAGFFGSLIDRVGDLFF